MDNTDSLEVGERAVSVFLYTGTPGSGKSLHMAKSIYWAVKFNRPVVANFDINRSMFNDSKSFHYVPNDEMKPENLIKFAQSYFATQEFREGAIKLYFDEAQLMLNSRDWRNNKDWIYFFTQHRKFGYDVFLVCQYHEMLDKQVRTIVEYEVSHRKVNNVGMFGALVGICTLGHPVVVAVTKWYGQKMRLSSEWMIGTSKYYKLYDTYKIFG